MADLSTFLLHFSLSQLFICAVLLAPKSLKFRPVLLFCLLLLSGSAYLLGLLPQLQPATGLLWWWIHLGSSALIGCFWLVVIAVFAETNRLKGWQYLLAVLPLACSLLLDLLLYISAQGPLLLYWGKLSILLLELGLVAHALVVALIHWRGDLVQHRRYLRAGIVGFIGVYFLLEMVSEQLLKLQISWLPTLKYMALACLVSCINYLLFQSRPGAFFDLQLKTPPNTLSTELAEDVRQILDAMHQQKLYRREGLTISDLADYLCIQEYKLRQLINKQLNYRNFNDFLNHYRIGEVAQKLAEKEAKATPILTLALESGFRSLSSFNKAFKQAYHMTPSEFRRNQN